jgi:hypothetical protein
MNETAELRAELLEWARLSHESGRHEGEADAFERAADCLKAVAERSESRRKESLEWKTMYLIAAKHRDKAEAQIAAASPVAWIGERDLQFLRGGSYREATVFNYEEDYRVPLCAASRTSISVRCTETTAPTDTNSEQNRA